MIEFNSTEYTELTLIEFNLTEIAEPAMLNQITPPNVDCSKGVVISGKGPIWLYCFLAHHYHPTAWVANYDPRLGYVVASSHSKSKRVGDIMSPAVIEYFG